ncbi:hypothetical protein [Candidatus Galacturonibacter soehngenii]|uniref:hypothetical protein n=1 Tax=Candidatus Galacturonatibacter soehngenii TaxID=2307010 RepID=UPI00177FBB4A|nr:hypothetical protein [Candidatus Galacturonibacter soehngenii]
MRQSILAFVILASVIIGGCSSSKPVTSQNTDTEKLEQRIAELEKENAELKASIEGNTDVEVEKEEVGTEEVAQIQIGDTIQTEKAEITIKNIEFSYDVLPDDTSSFYTHYPADEGNVYIHIDTDVKNTQKQNLNIDEIMSVEANYNNGYKYNSSPVPEDSSTGFTYANITSIKPLDTLGVRFLISCPQEVEESDNSLVLTLTIDKENYSYTVR